MTLTIELPDALASQLMTRTTEEERNAFVVEAVADALNPLSKEEGEAQVIGDGGIFIGGKPLTKEEQEIEERWIAALNAELDPEKEPERDAAECRAAIEASIAEAEAGGKSYSLEETWEWLEAQWAMRRAAKSA